MMNDMKKTDSMPATGPVEELRVLDPALHDESYWSRFRVRVMTRAADELFRRRQTADLSVVGVVEAWSRTLAPIAAVAAAIAGFLLLSDQMATTQPADLEELLMAAVESLSPGEEDFSPTGVQFASEAF